MMHNQALKISVCLLFVLLACKNADERSCFKSSGTNSKLEFKINPNIDSLFLFDNLEYEFFKSEEAKINIEGGQNVISFIDALEDNGKLTISNENKCNFLRNLSQRIKVQIYLPTLNYLRYEGSSSFTMMDTVESGALRVFIRDGAGPVKLKVNASYLETTVSHGVGNFEIQGKANACYLACNTNSFCDTRKLKIQEWIKVFSNTGGDMLVNTDGAKLNVIINRNGNVKYTGHFTELETQIKGEGELIALDE